MAIVTLVLGNSGSGKSFSMQNLDPSLCGVINVMGKPLPFRAGKQFRKLNTDNAYEINDLLPSLKAPIVIIDDFQYIMANEFMRGVTDEGGGNSVFQRFNRIGQNAWNILNTAINNTHPDQRIYIYRTSKKWRVRRRLKRWARCSMKRLYLKAW